MVTTNIGNKTYKMLYDTGSCITCMSEQTLRQLQTTNVPIQKLKSTIREFTSANGGKLRSLGLFKIPMTIENKQIQATFHVLSKLHENFILGIDFIKEKQLNLCLKHHKFYWTEKCPLGHGKPIIARDDIQIPPQSSKLCRIRIDTEEDNDSINYLAEIRLPHKPWLLGAPTIVKQDDVSSLPVIEMFNASLVPRSIKRNDVLGKAEVISPNEIMAINDLTSTSANRDISAIHPLSEFIRKNAKVEGDKGEREEYFKLFERYAKVFSQHKNDLGRCDLLQHEIHLKSKEPVYIKQFKIPEGHQQAVTQQVKEWLKLGIIQTSRSRYNSPIFVVKKKDGSFRLVQDFRALNQQTYIDKYSMRDVTECIHEIGRAESTIFSTIDLTSGFWQMVLEPKSRPLTAFTVYGMGQFEFKTSPMGLLGCPASFQRLMETVTKDIPNVIVYIDDILVHSKTHEEHRRTLRLLFERLTKHNLKIRLEKCHFGKSEVEYLGFRLTPKGIVPGTDKVKAVRDTPPPASVHQVRQFLGLCNFFRQHIKQFALRSHPLTKLTRKDTEWKGGKLPNDALKSFQELKTCLTSQPIVSFPKRELQYALITDAATGDDNSPGGMGAILTQIDKQGKFYVIAYASKKLEKHEKNYTPFLLEMYAAVWGMEHFAHHLKGKRFLLFTDHKPLEKLGKVHTKTLYRIQEAMLHFDFEIHYRKGSEMPADYLSRNVLAIDDEMQQLELEQNNDPQLSIIINFLRSNKIPDSREGRKLITKYGNRCFLRDDLLWIRFYDNQLGHRSLLCVPQTMRQPLSEKYHGSWYGGHEGITKTKQRLLNRYFWPNMEKDIQAEITKCHKCQLIRKDNNIKAPLKPLPNLSLPNQRIHADLFGPLKTSEKGKKFILVITDAFTKYAELIAIANKEADTVTEAIFNNWICRFGIPAELVTDQGKEFTATTCKKLWEQLDIIRSTTSPRHPQCNSQAEVVNKTIAKYLSAFVDETTLDWEPYLPALMFSYNTSFHRSIKTSPFFLTFGMIPNLPNEIGINYNYDTANDLMSRLQLARRIASQNMQQAMDKAKEYYDKKVKTYIFEPNQQVLLDEHYFLNKNQKLANKYSGPHIITKLKGDCNVELLLDNGKYAIVHVNRLKPYFSHDNDEQEFSKEGKDDSDSEKFDAESKEFAQIRQDPTRPTNQERQDLMTQQQGQQLAGRPVTRRYAQQQGLVYNRDTEMFQTQKASDAIKALNVTKRSRKRRTKILRHGNYFIVEHVYRVQQVNPLIKTEPNIIVDTDSSDSSGEEDEKADKYKTPEPSPEKPKTTPSPRVIARAVKFDPVIKKTEFHTPNEPEPSTSSKPSDSFSSFAKEVIKSTADTLFPPIKPEYSPDSRPIRGMAKSFHDLFPESPVVTKKEEPSSPTKGEPPDDEQRSGPSRATRSQDPVLDPGLP